MLDYGRVGATSRCDWDHAGDGDSEAAVRHGVAVSRQVADARWTGHGVARDAHNETR